MTALPEPNGNVPIEAQAAEPAEFEQVHGAQNVGEAAEHGVEAVQEGGEDAPNDGGAIDLTSDPPKQPIFVDMLLELDSDDDADAFGAVNVAAGGGSDSDSDCILIDDDGGHANDESGDALEEAGVPAPAMQGMDADVPEQVVAAAATSIAAPAPVQLPEAAAMDVDEPVPLQLQEAAAAAPAAAPAPPELVAAAAPSPAPQDADADKLAELEPAASAAQAMYVDALAQGAADKREIPKAEFNGLVDEIMQDFRPNMDPDAYATLHEVAESYLVDYFDKARAMAAHSNRVTVMPGDVRAVAQILGKHARN